MLTLLTYPQGTLAIPSHSCHRSSAGYPVFTDVLRACCPGIGLCCLLLKWQPIKNKQAKQQIAKTIKPNQSLVSDLEVVLKRHGVLQTQGAVLISGSKSGLDSFWGDFWDKS